MRTRNVVDIFSTCNIFHVQYFPRAIFYPSFHMTHFQVVLCNVLNYFCCYFSHVPRDNGASQALGLGGLRASSLEASGLHDTNLNTLSTKTTRGQELLGHKKEWKIKMIAVFFFTAHEKGFKVHAQPQTGAYFCLVSYKPGNSSTNSHGK